jgi:hypothetical protein
LRKSCTGEHEQLRRPVSSADQSTKLPGLEVLHLVNREEQPSTPVLRRFSGCYEEVGEVAGEIP